MMKSRTKSFGKRFLSLFLTLALMLTLVPTIALAEDAELIKFKNMHMVVLRNGTAIANYDYSTKRNDFEHDLAFALNDTWVKLDYVISYSQDVSLKLYSMKDDIEEYPEEGEEPQNWSEDNPLKLRPNIDPDSPPDYGAGVNEEFLDTFIGYLNGVRVTDNVMPVDENADFVEYQRIDEEDWNKIVWNAIDREAGDRSGCTTAKDIYAFGFEGESYAHYKAEKDAAEGNISAASFAETLATVEDIAESQELIQDENDLSIGDITQPVESTYIDDESAADSDSIPEGTESLELTDSDTVDNAPDDVTSAETSTNDTNAGVNAADEFDVVAVETALEDQEISDEFVTEEEETVPAEPNDSIFEEKMPLQTKRNDKSHPLHQVFHTGDGDTVAQGLIPRRIRSTGDIRPAVRVALQPFTFQWDQAAEQMTGSIVPLRYRPADDVCRVLVLPCAFRRGNVILLELIHSLSGKDTMPVRGGQGIGDIPLPANAVASVLRLAIDGVAGNADNFFCLNQRDIVSTGPIAYRHGGRYIMGAGVSSVNTVIFIYHGMLRTQYQRLVSMLLGPQGAGHILTALHDFSALVVDTEDAGHAVAAGAALECWRNGFIVGNGTGAGSCPGREARHKGLLLRVTACFIALTFTFL